MDDVPLLGHIDLGGFCREVFFNELPESVYLGFQGISFHPMVKCIVPHFHLLQTFVILRSSRKSGAITRVQQYGFQRQNQTRALADRC